VRTHGVKLFVGSLIFVFSFIVFPYAAHNKLCFLYRCFSSKNVRWPLS